MELEVKSIGLKSVSASKFSSSLKMWLSPKKALKHEKTFFEFVIENWSERLGKTVNETTRLKMYRENWRLNKKMKQIQKRALESL